MEHLEKKKLHEVHFNSKPYKTRSAEVALLRIAYLKAFSTFGYGFLFNENLGLIREQIQKATEEILPNLGSINDDFSKIPSGIYLVTEPREMLSFLVIFELMSNRTTKHGVILPGPGEPGLSIYTLHERASASSGIKYRAVRIPDQDYLRNQSLVFAPIRFWNEVVANSSG